MKISKWMFALSFPLLLLATMGAVRAQSAGGDIIRLDPAMDQVASPDTKVEVLTGNDFGITEGPVWIPQGQGYLLFSDIVANRIYNGIRRPGCIRCFWRTAAIRVLRKRSTRWPRGVSWRAAARGSIYTSLNFGSNGLTLDRQGRIVL